MQVQVKCSAFIFVPNKVVVGVSFVNGQKVEEKIPHIAVATNECRRYDEIDRFVRAACQKGGPFSNIYAKLDKGEPVAQRFSEGLVSMGRDRNSVTAYMMVLEQDLVI